MFKVGLTGGIGSGKTTVAKIFETLAIPIYYADTRAKELMVEKELVHQIKSIFGENAYSSDGKLERKYIAEVVFNNRQMLAKLNSVVHPAVEKDFLQWVEKQRAPYVIEEAAVLIESQAHLVMDRVIVVEAPIQERISRVVHRDGISDKAVQSRINAQLTDIERAVHADFIIKSGANNLILPQIVEIDKQIRKIILSL